MPEPTDSSHPSQPDDVAALRARLGIIAKPDSRATQPTDEDDQEGLGNRIPTQRWRLGWRPILAGTVALLLVAGVLAVRIQARAPGEVISLSDFETVVPTETESDAAPSASAEAAPPGEAGGAEQLDSELVLVHVAGAVKNPGVVELPAAARVFEAIDEAGGALDTADLTQVNLARTIADGEQLVVPKEGETAPAPGSSGPAPQDHTGVPIDINAASAADFETLPGIGPVLAERIIDHRERNGGFESIDQLSDVSGIGPSILGQIRELVRV